MKTTSKLVKNLINLILKNIYANETTKKKKTTGKECAWHNTEHVNTE